MARLAERVPLGADRQQPQPVAQGRRPQPHRSALPDLRRLRNQLSLGAPHRPHPIPLTGRLGHRRAWIVTLQAVIVACLVLWSLVEPTANLAAVVGIGLAIAIASATQDMSTRSGSSRWARTGRGHGRGGGYRGGGRWTGYKLGGIVALESATAFQNAGVEDYWLPFLVLGVVVILTNVGLVHEQGTAERIAQQDAEEDRIASRLGVSGPATWSRGSAATVVSPLMSFFRRNGFAIALTVLGFIFLFKIGEAFMGRAALLPGDRLLQVRDRSLLQGTRLDHDRDLHRAGRFLRHPDGTRVGHVPVGHRHGLHQSGSPCCTSRKPCSPPRW